MKKIVIIGGGTGTFTLLKGLRQFPTDNAVIVSTADDGGSTGRLRADYGVLPPGDLRQCLIGLSYSDEYLKQVFNYRFESGELAGQSVGNIFLTASELVSKNPLEALKLSARLLNVRGEIIPSTLKPTKLTALLNDGTKITGEYLIDEPKGNKFLDIKNLSLSPAPVNKQAVVAISQADAIVFGPGDLFTSIIPSLLVKEIKTAVLKSKAKKIYVASLMTKYGQTKNFDVFEFVSRLESFLAPGKRTIDQVIVNTQSPKATELGFYKKLKSEPVQYAPDSLEKFGYEIIKAKLLEVVKEPKAKGDKLQRSLLRHNSQELAKIVWESVQ